MKWKLQQQEKKLDKLFLLVKSIEDDEAKSLLSKFLCVRTSGFIESSVKNLVNEFSNGTSPKQIQKYVSHKIKYATNLYPARIAELLGAFDTDWKKNFESQITDEQKAALNSIISNRNNIAHGENDAINFTSMESFYTHAKEVVAMLENIISKN